MTFCYYSFNTKELKAQTDGCFMGWGTTQRPCKAGAFPVCTTTHFSNKNILYATMETEGPFTFPQHRYQITSFFFFLSHANRKGPLVKKKKKRAGEREREKFLGWSSKSQGSPKPQATTPPQTLRWRSIMEKKNLMIRCSNEKVGYRKKSDIVSLVYSVCGHNILHIAENSYAVQISLLLEWDSERDIITTDINQTTKSNPFHHDLCAQKRECAQRERKRERAREKERGMTIVPLSCSKNNYHF